VVSRRGNVVIVVVVDGRIRVDASAPHWVVRMAFPEVDPVHVIPSEEYASWFVPSPPATHLVPFHASAIQLVDKTPFPEAEAVQVIPSDEYAS
jgi:hypothetical protein